MDAKQYLRQIREMEIRISMRQRQILDLRKSVSYLRSMDYSADRVQTSPDGAGFTNSVIRLADMELDAMRIIRDCEAVRARIIDQIENIGDQRYSAILSGVYIHRKDLMDVAEDLHYDYYWCCHLHGEALSAFEKKYLQDRNQPQDSANNL